MWTNAPDAVLFHIGAQLTTRNGIGALSQVIGLTLQLVMAKFVPHVKACSPSLPNILSGISGVDVPAGLVSSINGKGVRIWINRGVPWIIATVHSRYTYTSILRLV